MRPLQVVLAWGAPVLLLFAHLFIAPMAGDEGVGLLRELGFRMLWILVAWAYLVWFVRVIWVGEGEE